MHATHHQFRKQRLTGCRMSFGYVMNRLGPGVLLNERGQGLVDATYRALGYRSDAPGVWVR